MKTTLFLAFVSAFSLYAGNTHSQNAKVTLSKSNSTLEVILNEIENQTDYLFIINSHVDTHQKSSVKVKETPVSEVLDDLFKDTDVHYMMEGTHIILSNKGVAKTPVAQQTRTVTGKIIDETGEPLIGVSVLVRGTNNGAITDVNGDYFITGNITDTTVLEITYIGMKKQTIEIGSRNRINVTMLSDAETLD
ncbi:STN domain-containing protein, partial [Bacteroides fluxus]